MKEEVYSQFSRTGFGNDFVWGVASSALQTEGASDTDGKGPGIWDTFSLKKNKILSGQQPHTAADFYNRYREDIDIISSLSVPNFRFSISWPRLLPEGTGKINQKGLDFYSKVIDYCLEKNITPWITLYHWDLPNELELKGGWTNRDMVGWFSEYVKLCMNQYKDRVKNWMVLNEPMVFTGAGYFLGVHAPGKKGLGNFLPAVHHTVLCQAAGARIIKEEDPSNNVGTTFSCSYLMPHDNNPADRAATKRMDVLLNRLFIEPALGMGYPTNDLPLLSRMEKYMKPGDEEKMKADFDFIGLQNYTREIVASSFIVPYMKAKLIPASKRKVYHTTMNWEVYPESIYEIIKQYSSYKGIRQIIITENGAAFTDVPENGKINDHERTDFISSYMTQVLKAKNEGCPVKGYFIWSLTDNFEWAEGYHQRFGLVYIDFNTQERIIKDSAYWFSKFLS